MATPQKDKFEITDSGGIGEETYGDDGMIDVINTGSTIQRFNIGRRKVSLKPNQKARVPKAYAMSRVGDNPNGDKMPSSIFLKTGGNVQVADPTLRNEVDKRLTKVG